MLFGDDLDEGRVTSAHVPVGMGQRQRLTEAHAGLDQGGEEQPVPQRPTPDAGRHVETCAPIQDGQHLGGAEQRWRTGTLATQAQRARRATAPSVKVNQHRTVTTPSGRCRRRPGDQRAPTVHIVVVAVKRHHRSQTSGDGRLGHLGRCRIGPTERGHRRRQPGRQPGQERSEGLDPRVLPRHAVLGHERPPQLQTLRIGAHRVRRRAEHPVILQELLDRLDTAVIVTEHRPRTRTVENIDRLDPHPPHHPTLSHVVGHGKITSRQRQGVDARAPSPTSKTPQFSIQISRARAGR